MKLIQSVEAREILDSRGAPTIEVEMTVAGASAIASVPSGASVGAHEAVELRDEDGRGVSNAIVNVNEVIAAAIVGKEFDQRSLDVLLRELDGTPNKSRLGANAILGVSIAFARASARADGVPLYRYLGALDGRTSFQIPQPLFNVLNGGKHARDGIDIQECMLAPTGLAKIEEKVRAAEECMAKLKELLEELGYETPMGDEGGYAPNLSSNEEALELLVTSIERAGYAGKIEIALDVAASSFYKDGHYVLKSGGEREISGEELLTWYSELAERYPIISIEDGFAEDDWQGFVAMTSALGEKIHIVGDDLTVTSVARIEECIAKKACNACIIKPNQVGTVTEAIDAVRRARTASWSVFASHRSGETMDTFIADFATGLSCDFIKAGAPTRPERMVKYTRLMEIEAELAAV